MDGNRALKSSAENLSRARTEHSKRQNNSRARREPRTQHVGKGLEQYENRVLRTSVLEQEKHRVLYKSRAYIRMETEHSRRQKSFIAGRE